MSCPKYYKHELGQLTYFYMLIDDETTIVVYDTAGIASFGFQKEYYHPSLVHMQEVSAAEYAAFEIKVKEKIFKTRCRPLATTYPQYWRDDNMRAYYMVRNENSCLCVYASVPGYMKRDGMEEVHPGTKQSRLKSFEVIEVNREEFLAEYNRVKAIIDNRVNF